MDKIETLSQYIKEAKSIVFFGGAGVSTESGIPDFRSVDGLYSQKFKYPPEEILSHDFFINNTSYFYDFYRKKMIATYAKPNACHYALQKLESAGKLDAVITQNIDGLHFTAGSKKVYELHGSVLRNYCMKCGKFYGVDKIIDSTDVPKCSCGGTIKPDVVLYGEMLPEKEVELSINAIMNADLLIVAGTSLTVYPAAGFLHYFKGGKIVLINKTETSFDDRADLIIRDSVGSVFERALSQLNLE